MILLCRILTPAGRQGVSEKVKPARLRLLEVQTTREQGRQEAHGAQGLEGMAQQLHAQLHPPLAAHRQP